MFIPTPEMIFQRMAVVGSGVCIDLIAYSWWLAEVENVRYPCSLPLSYQNRSQNNLPQSMIILVYPSKSPNPSPIPNFCLSLLTLILLTCCQKDACADDHIFLFLTSCWSPSFSKPVITCDNKSYQCLSAHRTHGKSLTFLLLFSTHYWPLVHPHQTLIR